MKCLEKYQWVKLPRNALPTGKGIMGAWMKLASRAAFRKGVAFYCGYKNAVEPGMWAGGIVGLKSILGVKSRARALEALDKLAQLGYLTYELDKETKKLTYQITDWVVKCSGRECSDGAVYTTDGYGFLCLPWNITERLAKQHYKFEESDAWLDLWCHTVWEDPDNEFSFFAPTVQYSKYGANLTLETLGQRWGWEKTKVWRFLRKHGDAFALYRLPGSYDLTFTTDYYPYRENWTLKEISAGEGYKVSTVVTNLCEIPAGSNEEFNDNTVTVVNEIKRGGVSVQKRDSKTGTTPQGDANFAGIVFEIINDSSNSVEVDGKVVAPGKVAKEITTNAQGFATTGPNSLPYGDYIIREKSTNTSMRKTFTDEIQVTVSEDNKVYPFYADNDVARSGLAVQKRDSQTGEVPQGNADFSGIVFEVVNSSANAVVVDGTTYTPGKVVATLTTNERGYASTADDALPYGRYTVREKSTNKSMLLTWPQEMVTGTENKKVYSVTAVDDVVRGGLSVEKRDTITGSTPQGDADFEGITFEVINNSRHPVIVNDKSIAPGAVALTLTTDAEGKCSTANDALPYGEYILHEASTNKSMLNTAEDQIVTIDEHLKVYPFYMDNEVVRGGVLIEKRDLESLLLTPLGGASLDGTLFEITNKSKHAVYVNGALYEPDEVCLTIEVKDGVAQSGDHALPYGTYSMVESKPGKGYLWTDKKVRDFTVREDGEVTEYREGEAAYNQVIRGDLKFVKVGEKNMHRFANVAFKLTSQTTGESHILVTDENGEVRTETQWNAHTLNTNGNDDKPEIEWDDLTGSWYGLTTEGWIVETQDGLCALPFDHYVLEELRCKGNEGYELVTVPDISITRDNTVIELGTIDDHEDNGPKIGTTATVKGEQIAEPVSEITLVDVVSYSNLEVGKTYKLSGVLMDKETGKPLEVDGHQVTAWSFLRICMRVIRKSPAIRDPVS